MNPRFTTFLIAACAFFSPAFPLGAQDATDAPAAQMTPVPLSLRDAVDSALLKNLGVAVARIDTGIVAENIEIAESSFETTFNASSQWSRSLSPEISGFPQNRAIGDTWANSLGLTKRFENGGSLSLSTSLSTGWTSPSGASFTPDNDPAVGISGRLPLLQGGGRLVNLAPIVHARKNLAKSELNLRIAALDLLRDTEVAYWTLSASHALLALRESSLKSAEELLRRARARHEEGEATRQDELQAEAEVASQKVSIVNARESIATAEDNLRILLSGMAGEKMAPIAVAPLPEVAPEPPVSFAKWISGVRAFDLDAQIRAIEIEQARLDTEVAENANQASLDLVGGVSIHGRDRHINDAYAGMFERTGYNANIGVQLSMPIGFRETEARLSQARQRTEQARLRYASAQQQVMLNARAAHRSLSTACDRLNATGAAVELRREAYRGEVAKLNSGASTMSDVLQARASLDSSELNHLQSLLDCVVAAARVSRLDGKILPNLGFSWNEIDARTGAEPDTKDEFEKWEK